MTRAARPMRAQLLGADVLLPAGGAVDQGDQGVGVGVVLEERF